MSQTTITLAFEQWKAQQAIDGQAVVLDEFVLANVPNLDIDSPIDRAEQLPAAQYIVHRQAVSATGLVNENAVVYSVTMGAEVGDFEFNWVGLINKATGALAMIVHAPLQSKIKNADGKQGNVLTRSFLMEYNGAASETQITTPAETWQIDFTARLSGMDERQRLESVDLYGAAAFFGDGFLVTRAASQYSITQGIGYVGGLRCKLPATQNITVTTKPVKVWADVCWKGTLTSVWAEELKITVANTLANYVQDGVQHYVFAVASIDANGVITDLRPKGTLDGQQGYKDFLRIDKSLSEIAEKGEAAQGSARKNLALGDAATKNVQKSITDNTPYTLMINNAWGLGGNGVGMLDSDILSPTSIGNTFFNQGGGAANNHFGNHGTGIHLSYGSSGDNSQRLTANLFVDGTGNLSVEWLAVIKSNGAIARQYIQKLYGPLNKPTASDVEALPIGGGTVTGLLKCNQEIQTTYANSYRIAYGNYGTFWRNDGSSLYLMLTNKGDQYGSYNALRPFILDIATGELMLGKTKLSDYAHFDARYYTRAASDNKYQPKGNYQPSGNYALAGASYSKAESDTRYAKAVPFAGAGGVGTYTLVATNITQTLTFGKAMQGAKLAMLDANQHYYAGSALAGTWIWLGHNSGVGGTWFFGMAYRSA